MWIFDGIVPGGLVSLIRNAMAHPVALTVAGLWIFWCMGYAPVLKRKWRSAGGMAVVANIVLASLLVLRILGIV